MNEINYDDGIKKLEEIINKLEDPKTPLEESFELYKDAKKLAINLREKIEKMEKDIRDVQDDIK